MHAQPLLHRYRKIFAMAIWAALALAADARATASTPTDCDAYSQAGRLTCLRTAAAASEVKLAQSHQVLVVAIAAWYEDARYQAAAKRSLVAADRAFAKYRAAQCELNKALGGGAIGAALQMRQLLCVEALNTARAAQLEQWGTNLGQR